MENRSCRACRTAQIQHGKQLRYSSGTLKKATQVHEEQGMPSMGNSSSTEWGAALVLHREQLSQRRGLWLVMRWELARVGYAGYLSSGF